MHHIMPETAAADPSHAPHRCAPGQHMQRHLIPTNDMHPGSACIVGAALMCTHQFHLHGPVLPAEPAEAASIPVLLLFCMRACHACRRCPCPAPPHVCQPPCMSAMVLRSHKTNGDDVFHHGRNRSSSSSSSNYQQPDPHRCAPGRHMQRRMLSY